ncbi:MAG: Trp biosynthesis-associated membrane protein [Actinomycetales bacterium]|nr:Trp biosynthesis-associated membrane protein [Actinomycetales bacterium]
MTMNYRKFKSYSLFAAFVLSAIVLIGWSQTWFFLEVTFPTENSEGLAVSGQIAAPGLSAFGLAGFAITAALALSSIVIRRILGVLLLGLGVAVLMISISAWSDPVLAAVPQLTALSAISDIETLRTFVISSAATAWPGITAVAGILLVPVGIIIVFTAGKWGTGSRKFERVDKNTDSTAKKAVEKSEVQSISDVSSVNIDAWDSLSHGTDPTIN